jgi:hypothetical protein
MAKDKRTVVFTDPKDGTKITIKNVPDVKPKR